jgi:hypothetical protein
MRNGFDCSRNLEATKIGATKHVSGVRRRREEPNVNRNGSVQTDTVSFYRTAERRLFDQMSGSLFERSIYVSSNKRAINMPTKIHAFARKTVPGCCADATNPALLKIFRHSFCQKFA